MYAVVQIGSKQFRVQQGDEILVDPPAKGDLAPRVLMLVDGKDVITDEAKLGKVKLTLEGDEVVKGEKVRVFTYRAKSGGSSTRRKGHRQTYRKVRVAKLAKA